jgi:hypothetical protein
VDVRNQLALGFEANEATDGHVLADLADQSGTGRLDRTFTHRQRGQRSDVSRVLVSNQSGTAVGQRDELVVLGNEVGFAVHFDDRAGLAVSGDADRDDAFCGDAGSGLGGLVAQLDAQISSALAMSPSASVSAFLHSIMGASVLPRSSAPCLR